MLRAVAPVLVLLVLQHWTSATALAEPRPPARVSPLETLPDLALGVYRPAFPDKLAVVDEYERASGTSMPIVHWFALWGGWKREFSLADLEAVRQRGSTPMISWEPWAARPNDPEWTLREAILSGRNDAYVEAWATGLASYGRPVILRFAHEMHHQQYPWALGVNGNTADDYVAAWRHVHDIFEKAGATNVSWVWNPNTMGAASADRHLQLYRQLYPGDAYVDLVGIDVYNTGPELDWGAPYWRSFADVLREPYAAITALTDKPLILPEVGSTEQGGSKGEWIGEALSPATLEQFPRLRALIWYDIPKEQPWQLGSSPEALAAWLRASARLSPGRQVATR